MHTYPRSAATYKPKHAALLLLAALALAAAVLLATRAIAVTELPKLLQDGVPVSRLTGAESSETVFQIPIPEGATNLRFYTTGGTGDCDLYARFGVHPETTAYDASSQTSNTAESITIADPQPGVWYVMVYGFSQYSGVRLNVKYDKPANSASTPRLNPAPGNFADSVNLSMRSKAGGKIFYTLDGSEPDETSFQYRRPITFTETTTLKAVAILKNGSRSPVVEGVYDIQPSLPAIDLQSGVPAMLRAGNHASMTQFKITVPEGQLALRVTTDGGIGNTSLFVQQGAPATTRSFTARANSRGNLAQITVPNPAPGDWYICLRGMGNFSGCQVLAKLISNKPDLIIWGGSLNPYLSTETFDPNSCEVLEGLVKAGTRRLLRFTSDTRNVGGADLVVGDPVGNPNTEYAECHGHYHFKGFASYRLLNQDGTVAALGNKVSFCIEDVRQWNPKAPVRTTKFDCSFQGLHTGWADIYDSGLPGQHVDVTDVPAGDYILEIEVNPDRVIDEDDYDNNITRIRVTIPPPAS